MKGMVCLTLWLHEDVWMMDISEIGICSSKETPIAFERLVDLRERTSIAYE